MIEAQTWDQLDARPIPPWYPAAKFGIFIHWGPFSVPAWRTPSDELFGGYAEWYYASVYGNYRNADGDYHARTWGEGFSYRDFAPLLTAERFDPHDWAALFRDAGARYVVLTSKHHDGYCMWPTSNPHKTNWNAGDVGPRRDILGELAGAVRAEGMRMGLYYSMPEWETHRSHRCDGGYFIPEADARKFGIDPDAYPDEVLHAQWKELNERYAPSVIYTDGGEWDLDEEYTRTRELLTWLYEESPNRNEVVVNDRMHVGMPGNHGDYFSTEYCDIEGYGSHQPWEESRGIGKSYGYNQAEAEEDYSTAAELLDLLVSTVGRGGNLLLNIGPKADGTIPEIQRRRLLDIGSWLKANGDAIYDTMPVDLDLPEGAYAVERDGLLYILLTSDGPEALELPQGITRVEDLASGEPIEIEEGCIHPQRNRQLPCAMACTMEGRTLS
ncbi:alpha-L-fucosidase [Schaalia hyovaginalis]|uniref:alpha-L-fucosidase n=1 Tax=Schaalia hyovaginalis TaxID=29316 RepID=A0A923E1V2_9ACTO|nr:alpha-L-fucosidase [Schaalia hyovaginalis]MBB6334423.1 alpha-L-fucosidase [Schaalia hyovaginalis]MDY2668732.1 alpha-L-fucosidase [Schaalia hyovaginalis]